jgi:hypothetical protein
MLSEETRISREKTPFLFAKDKRGRELHNSSCVFPCCDLSNIICPIVLFYYGMVLSYLRFTASDNAIGIFKFFFYREHLGMGGNLTGNISCDRHILALVNGKSNYYTIAPR